LFNGRHFDREVIVLCVRWYLRYKLTSALRAASRQSHSRNPLNKWRKITFKSSVAYIGRKAHVKKAFSWQKRGNCATEWWKYIINFKTVLQNFRNRSEKPAINIMAELDSDHVQQSNCWYFQST
jgi:hypothetical protein